jgi:hypothetical protein
MYDFLLKDLKKDFTQKRIGTDKGLAKIGDGVINLSYSLAKSIYLTQNSKNNNIIRTGVKVSRTILAEALKLANMKNFAKNRADAHDMADTVEALVAFVYLNNFMTINDITNHLLNELSGNLLNRQEEIETARKAFRSLLIKLKEYLPLT